MALVFGDSIGGWQQAAQQERGQDAADYFNALSSIRAKRALDLQQQQQAFTMAMEAARMNNAAVLAQRQAAQQDFVNRMALRQQADNDTYRNAYLANQFAGIQARSNDAANRLALGYDNLAVRQMRDRQNIPLMPSLVSGNTSSSGVSPAALSLPAVPQEALNTPRFTATSAPAAATVRPDRSGVDVTIGAMPAVVPHWSPDTQRQAAWLARNLSTQMDDVNREIAFYKNELSKITPKPPYHGIGRSGWDSEGEQTFDNSGYVDKLFELNQKKFQLENMLKKSGFDRGITLTQTPEGTQYDINVPYSLSGPMPTKQFIPAKLEDINPRLLDIAIEQIKSGVPYDQVAKTIAPNNKHLLDLLKNVQASARNQESAFRANFESVKQEMDAIINAAQTSKEREAALLSTRFRELKDILKNNNMDYIPPFGDNKEGRLLWGSAANYPTSAPTTNAFDLSKIPAWDPSKARLQPAA